MKELYYCCECGNEMLLEEHDDDRFRLPRCGCCGGIMGRNSKPEEEEMPGDATGGGLG